MSASQVTLETTLPARAQSAAAVISQQIFIFGGLGTGNAYLNDIYMISKSKYFFKKKTNTLDLLSKISPHGSLSARYAHTASFSESIHKCNCNYCWQWN